MIIQELLDKAEIAKNKEISYSYKTEKRIIDGQTVLAKVYESHADKYINKQSGRKAQIMQFNNIFNVQEV